MTQQFKFGDRVIYKFRHCIVIKTSDNFAYIMGEDRGYTVPINELELTPHPDTVRLNFIEKIINIDGMVKREMKNGWVLFVEHELSDPKPLLRDAIDAAMQSEEDSLK
nr:hypothetical protein [Neisseria meningitidis]DAO68966.1 MAG TPA: hypothetical protein [Caudoviricetes sp.]DAQ50832.1 MAG TPA: hypothetical protein [Caudoviricetes sp.]DAU37630.1 MAG TPA: hypothetical protein [Caudoviricetes sp.]